MKRGFIFLASVGMYALVVGLIASCSSSSGSSGVSTLSGLPSATGPVSGSGSISKGSGRDIQLFAATTGVTLAGMDSVSWTGSTKSRPFCESAKLIREGYYQAAEPDKILCYIKGMTDNGLFAADVYDGTYKYYSLTPPGRPTGMKIKFKVAKNGGNISTFEMFMCEGSSQNGYVSEDVSNPAAATVSNKFIQASGSNWSFASSISATGAINSSGEWSSKVLTLSNTSEFGASGSIGSFRQKATITQYSNRVFLDAFMAGTYGNATFSNQFYSVVQLLNPSSLATFALGDGSSKYTISHDDSDNNKDFSSSGTVSWTGDDQAKMATASDGEQYATANAATLRSVESVSVSYSSAETWDCSAPAGFSEVDFNAAGGAGFETSMNACDSKFGADDRNYINCQDVTGE